MGLALPGRAEDGVGDVIPGLIHLTGICVLPEEQGKGVGSRLLDHLLGVARATGQDRASLWASADNDRGQRLFQSRGFVRTGRVSPDGLGPELVHYQADLGATPQLLTPASKGWPATSLGKEPSTSRPTGPYRPISSPSSSTTHSSAEPGDLAACQR